MIYLFLILLCVVFLLSYLFYKASVRLLQFDTLFEAIQEDLEMNLEFVNKAFGKDLLSNEPEVMTFHKNMLATRERMVFYIEQLRKVTNRKEFFEKRNQINQNKPVGL